MIDPFFYRFLLAFVLEVLLWGIPPWGHEDIILCCLLGFLVLSLLLRSFIYLQSYFYVWCEVGKQFINFHVDNQLSASFVKYMLICSWAILFYESICISLCQCFYSCCDKSCYLVGKNSPISCPSSDLSGLFIHKNFTFRLSSSIKSLLVCWLNYRSIWGDLVFFYLMSNLFLGSCLHLCSCM